MVTNKYWTREHLREVMDDFSADFKNKKYSEKIEYELWRKIRNVKTPIISYNNTVVNIFEGYNHTPENWEKVASFKIYDWGFGRFLYDNYFNEEVKNNMSSISATNKNASNITATVTNATVDTTLNGYFNSSAVDSIKLDSYGNVHWSDRTGDDGTYATTSLVNSCDICYHKNKCDNCYYAKKANENKNDEGEKTKMKGFNFDFGPCTNDQVRMSMYGLAIKNASGEWVSYNDGQVVNVDVLNFDGAKYMFKMPVAVKDIAVGDIVIHNRVPMFVESVENGIHVVDIRAGEKKEILPTTNMFGFNFVTKIISLFNAFQSSPTPDQPFGNMLPFLMLNGEDGKSMDSDTMLMFMMMQNQNGSTNIFANPMMLYFLMKDKGGNDILPLMLMMNQSK